MCCYGNFIYNGKTNKRNNKILWQGLAQNGLERPKY